MTIEAASSIQPVVVKGKGPEAKKILLIQVEGGLKPALPARKDYDQSTRLVAPRASPRNVSGREVACFPPCVVVSIVAVGVTAAL